MPSSGTTAFQAIQNSQSALQRGEKRSARYWAGVAAALAPELEEPWLLLAAIASPLASVGYLKQALKINPESPRARTGLVWALKRVDKQRSFTNTAILLTPDQPVLAAKTIETAPLRLKMQARTPSWKTEAKDSLFLILLAIFWVAILALAILNASPVVAFFTNQGPPAEQKLISPTPRSSSPMEMSFPLLTTIPTTPPDLAADPTIEPTPTVLPTEPGPIAAEVYQSQANPSNPNANPTYTYSGSKRIEVNISQQHMYVYDGDSLVFSFIVSTGMDNATRVGSFSVLDKIPSAYGSTWDIWMPNWLGIYYSGNIENGIHALPILSDGATLWEGYLGWPISYGCIVLSANDSQLLYDWVDIGTPVIIEW